MSAITDMTAMLMEEAKRLMEIEDPEQIAAECNRSKALTDLSGQILSQGRMYLDAAKLMDSAVSADTEIAARKMLGE